MIPRAILIRMFTVVLLLFSLAPLHAQPFRFDNARRRETIDFKFVKNLIIIPVTINGKGPYNFILDTGVSIFLITDPELISLLDIKNYRITAITGLGERGSITAYTTPSINVRIGSNIVGDTPAAILQSDLLDLDGLAGMPIHGLIGYDFFSSFIVKIRYTFKTITVYKRETAYAFRKGSKIPMTIEERKPYVTSEIVISGNHEINAKLIIDTGAGHPISMETDDSGNQFEIPEASVPANLGVGLSGPIAGHLSRLSSVRLGDYKLVNVISAFPDYKDVGAKTSSVNRNGSIGNHVLKHFDVVFDYSRNSLYLKPSFIFNEPFEHDMTGMQLEFAGKNYKRTFIYCVDSGSVADKAELKAGDEILAINFKPVSELSADKIEQLFHMEDNRNLLLHIYSSGSKKQELVLLTLKRRL